jgi:hypothetical protein
MRSTFSLKPNKKKTHPFVILLLAINRSYA